MRYRIKPLKIDKTGTVLYLTKTRIVGWIREYETPHRLKAKFLAKLFPNEQLKFCMSIPLAQEWIKKEYEKYVKKFLIKV